MEKNNVFEFIFAAVLGWIVFSLGWLFVTFLAPFSGWFETVMCWAWVLTTAAFAILTLTRMVYFLIKGK